LFVPNTQHSYVEAAEILGISRTTVQKYYHKGWLPGYKMPGKTAPIRLYRDGVERFLQATMDAAPASHPMLAGEEMVSSPEKPASEEDQPDSH
jgi:excisionase family DNA binding protein